MEPDKLKLKNVTVKYVNRNDSKYGESFAVLVDEHIDGCPYDNEEDSEEVKAITNVLMCQRQSAGFFAA